MGYNPYALSSFLKSCRLPCSNASSYNDKWYIYYFCFQSWWRTNTKLALLSWKTHQKTGKIHETTVFRHWITVLHRPGSQRWKHTRWSCNSWWLSDFSADLGREKPKKSTEPCWAEGTEFSTQESWDDCNLWDRVLKRRGILTGHVRHSLETLRSCFKSKATIVLGHRVF